MEDIKKIVAEAAKANHWITTKGATEIWLGTQEWDIWDGDNAVAQLIAKMLEAYCDNIENSKLTLDTESDWILCTRGVLITEIKSEKIRQVHGGYDDLLASLKLLTLGPLESVNLRDAEIKITINFKNLPQIHPLDFEKNYELVDLSLQASEACKLCFGKGYAVLSSKIVPCGRCCYSLLKDLRMAFIDFPKWTLDEHDWPAASDEQIEEYNAKVAAWEVERTEKLKALSEENKALFARMNEIHEEAMYLGGRKDENYVMFSDLMMPASREYRLTGELPRREGDQGLPPHLLR